MEYYRPPSSGELIMSESNRQSPKENINAMQNLKHEYHMYDAMRLKRDDDARW